MSNSRHWLTSLVIAMLLMVIAAGCTAKPDPTATPIPATPTQGVQLGPEPPPTVLPGVAANTQVPTAAPVAKPVGKPVPPKAGESAYAFELQDLEGNTISLESMQGKYLMLNFWASWCGPCRAEIPHMIKLYDELSSEGFEVLAVNLREDTPKVEAFVEQMGMQFPVVLDTKGAVGNAYFVRGIPTSVFIDPDGLIKFVHTGTLTDAQLREYVTKLMQ